MIMYFAAVREDHMRKILVHIQYVWSLFRGFALDRFSCVARGVPRAIVITKDSRRLVGRQGSDEMGVVDWLRDKSSRTSNDTAVANQTLSDSVCLRI